MSVWRIAALRKLRELFGRSQDWRTMPVSTRGDRDFVSPEPAPFFVVTVPQKEFKLTKSEWEALIGPYRGRV